ncbi:MAG: GDP-mannose 4,6-dehydratase [Myxococcales bacterium]|nr:GDP-mannose 4,6-dehydratase [Myxococcales bacterium]
MRPLNHTGPGQSADFVCSDFARQVARIKAGLAEPLVRVGNLAPERDFSDVRDIIRAYGLAVTMDRPRGEVCPVFNLASGRAVSIRWVLETLIRIAGVDIRVEEDPSRLRPVDIPRIVGDARKFQEATGWRPRLTIERTLEDLLDHWFAVEQPN